MATLSTPALVLLAILLFPLVLAGSIVLDLVEAEVQP
jgi:hypothetical protein